MFHSIETKADIATASDTIAVRILDLVEPLIRADQIAKDHNDYDGDPSAGWHLEYQQSAIRALKARLKDTQRQAKELTEQRVNLRAQVEARRLEVWDEYRSIDFPGEHVRKRALTERAKALQDVLDLMDGIVE